MLKLTTISLSLATLIPIALTPTFAFAQQPAPKAATPAQPPAKGAPVAPPVAPPMPPKPPTPAQELTDMAKQMAGAWKCAGTADVAGEMKDIKATITHKVDTNLNKFWIQSSFTGTVAKMPPMKFTSFTTYDADKKKLYRMSANGFGGHSVVWGTIGDKKISWEGDARFRTGDVRVRMSEEFVGPKEVKVMGESSKDGGKTWSKDHEATCKK